MSGERTILKPGVPRFSINEVAYPRISAIKGYIEPLKIFDIQFSPANNEYVYKFLKSHSGDPTRAIHPINLLESELITLCEAFDIQIPVLERELAEMEQKLVDNCLTSDDFDTIPDWNTFSIIDWSTFTADEWSTFIAEELPILFNKPNTPKPVVDRTKITPPGPRFGYNEVVYLKETAQVVGRLEAYRIDNMSWNNNIREWVYVFEIRPRPRRNMTVGDRDDMRRGSVIEYPESQLCLLCESIKLAVDFLELAVKRAQQRKLSFCI